jgi:hypothetical protein
MGIFDIFKKKRQKGQVNFWIDNYLTLPEHGLSPDKKVLNGTIDTIKNNEYNDGYKGDVKEGKKDGVWISKDGNSKVYYVHCNYKEGILDGEYQLHYHEDNHNIFVELHGNYKNGKKHGLWKVYEDGSLIDEETFKEDEVET